MKIRQKIVLFALFVTALMGLPLSVSAQTIDELNSQRKEAEREIKRLDTELSLLESSTQSAQKELSLCTERLNSRKQVLESIESQIKLLNELQREQSDQAKVYTTRLASMKSAYGVTLRKVYTIRQSLAGSEMALNDSIQSRQVYLYSMTKVLMGEIENLSTEILEMQGIVGEELRDIALRQEKLDVLRQDAKVALTQIESEKEKIEALRKELDGKTQQLSAQREEWLKASAELQERIAEAIAQELAANSADNNDETLEISSKDFEKYRGKMNSPLANSRIIDTYGVHNHPTQAGVKIDNKGVNLEAKANENVRVVASGEVRKIFKVAGMGASILVRHGQYITVYSNLTTVQVTVGDTITGGSIIGQVGTDGMLHFEIWNETTNENPTHWIKF